jgi:hypothetical protein
MFGPFSGTGSISLAKIARKIEALRENGVLGGRRDVSSATLQPMCGAAGLTGSFSTYLLLRELIE